MEARELLFLDRGIEKAGCAPASACGFVASDLFMCRFFPIWFRDGLLLGPVAASILQGLSPASIAILSITAQRLSMRIGACSP